MTDLVVYYSRTNKTKEVAETIAQEKNAKIVQINDKKDRSGPIKYMLGALDSLRGSKTSIEYENVNLKDYETVYIGTPVWASKPAPAVNQFISENDFKDVNVVCFATMMGSGGKSTTENMAKEIKSKGGNVIDSFDFSSKNTDLRKLTLEKL